MCCSKTFTNDVFESLSLFGRTLRSVSTSSGSSTMRPLRVGDCAQVAMALDPILTCKLWSTANECGCLLGDLFSVNIIMHLNAQAMHYISWYIMYCLLSAPSLPLPPLSPFPSFSIVKKWNKCSKIKTIAFKVKIQKNSKYKYRKIFYILYDKSYIFSYKISVLEKCFTVFFIIFCKKYILILSVRSYNNCIRFLRSICINKYEGKRLLYLIHTMLFPTTRKFDTRR